MALQPGIDRHFGGMQLDRNVSTKARTSCKLFVESIVLDQQGFTMLHLVVLGQRSIPLESVLGHWPGDVDTPDMNGRTPLLWATWRGDINNVALLIKYKADVDKTDSQKWTPLARAANAGHVEVVRLLLDAGTSTTIANKHGFYPVHHASGNRASGCAVLELILLYGADPRARDTWEATPLHNAANRLSIRTIAYLLANGFDIDATDKYGDTPAMVALLCWNEEALMHSANAGACLDLYCSDYIVVHVAVWTVSTKVWDLLISHRQSGLLTNVDIGKEHDGHGIRMCFENCRSTWYPVTRDDKAIEKERAKLKKMFKIFAGESRHIIGPQPASSVNSVLE
jgi:hypothetical protein